MSVWIVFYGNYYPREVDAIFETKEQAEAHATALGSDWYVEEWEVRTVPAQRSTEF